MTIEINAPIDVTHQSIVGVRNQIMGWFDDLRRQVAVWEPAPFDPNWHSWEWTPDGR